MSATMPRDDAARSGAELTSEGSAIRRSDSGVVIPGPARLPREAEAMMAASARDTGARDAAAQPREVEGPALAAPAPHAAIHSAGGIAPSLPPPVARFGKYEVLGRVAVGGMAEIFLARENLPGGAIRKGALKIIKRGAVADEEAGYFEELFLREGRTIVQLAHPHICHVYDIGKEGDQLYIAMEWIDGRSLRDVLARLAKEGELMLPALAVGIAAQVASALQHAHTARDARGRRLNVVHRDVNPQNIMLRYDGSVKLVDFGVARVSAEVDSRENTVKGKPSYMAPEQLLNKEIDARADVFALGVCLHEMLTGLRLHKRANMRETLAAVLQEPAPSLLSVLPGLPPALDAIVQRALAKQPEDRFASAGEFQAALEQFLAESGEVGSARRMGELMERLFPVAQRSTALDTSSEASQRLRTFVPSVSGLFQGPAARSRRWLGFALLGAVALAITLALVWPRGASETPPLQHPRPRAESPAGRAAPSAAPARAEAPPEPAAPELAAPAPLEPAVAAPSTARSAPAREPSSAPRSRRRAKSPGFVADPGF